jgi:hypothetical protein
MPGSHLRLVGTLDFGVLDGLGTRAAAEIRAAEDALIAFIEAEQKRDALHAKTKQERMAQQSDALFTKDEERARSGSQGIENQAYYDAHEVAAVCDDVQESLTNVITQARELRARIQSGVLPEKDARKLLAVLRKQRAELVAKIAPTKSMHDSAQATLKDPAPGGRR